jgi:hypothetical protein
VWNYIKKEVFAKSMLETSDTSKEKIMLLEEFMVICFKMPGEKQYCKHFCRVATERMLNGTKNNEFSFIPAA